MRNPEVLKQRIVRTAGVVAVAYMGLFGFDKDPQSIYAADLTPGFTPTPTPTPTVTFTPVPTPDAGDIRKSRALATATAVRKDEEVAKIEAENEAVRRRIDALRATPTTVPVLTPPTPSPQPAPKSEVILVPVTVTPNPDSIIIDRKTFNTFVAQGVEAVLAAQAPTPTFEATPSPRPSPTPIPSPSGGGGLLWISWAWAGLTTLTAAELAFKLKRGTWKPWPFR